MQNTTGGLCECGCGQPAPLAKRTDRRQGTVKGEPQRYIRGHSMKSGPDDVPRECACGCGKLTTLRNGHAKKFVHGHNSEVRNITEADYTVTETGFGTPCWIWNRTTSEGRGKVQIDKKKTYPYRVLYTMLVGEIPQGYVLHHLCENPLCVNPEHLQPMTQSKHIKLHRIPGHNRRSDS
jgi:hypothetical protein